MSASGPQRWTVVGGGMLGLALAGRLVAGGHRVTVLDAAPEIGGLAAAWDVDGVVWDRHYHVILPGDARLRGLLAEIGLEREIRWVPTRTGCYAGGRLYSVSSTLELLRLPVLGVLDTVRLGLTVLRASRIRDGRPLEAIPAERWLTRWSGRRTYERFWLPLLRSKLGENHRLVSASFIWAIIRRLYSARTSGQKRECFGYVPGGYARILEVLQRQLAERGVSFRLGAPVERVAPAADGPGLVVRAGGTETRADRVVVTAAAPIAARLCPSLTDGERQALMGIRYQGVVCASLLLRRPLAGFYVTNILDDGFPFTGVIEMTALVDPSELGGRTLVYLPRYVPAGDPFLERGDDEVRDELVAGLLRMYPELTAADVTACRISRASFVQALATLGYSDRLPPMRTATPGLFLVNSAHIVNGTLNVNETVDLARRAIPLLLADAGGGNPPGPPVPSPR